MRMRKTEDERGWCGADDTGYGTGDSTVEVVRGLFGGGARGDGFEGAVWGGGVGVGALMEGSAFRAKDEGVLADGRGGRAV